MSCSEYGVYNSKQDEESSATLKEALESSDMPQFSICDVTSNLNDILSMQEMYCPVMTENQGSAQIGEPYKLCEQSYETQNINFESQVRNIFFDNKDLIRDLIDCQLSMTVFAAYKNENIPIESAYEDTARANAYYLNTRQLSLWLSLGNQKDHFDDNLDSKNFDVDYVFMQSHATSYVDEHHAVLENFQTQNYNIGVGSAKHQPQMTHEMGFVRTDDSQRLYFNDVAYNQETYYTLLPAFSSLVLDVAEIFESANSYCDIQDENDSFNETCLVYLNP